jgi:5-methyltetrahydrofolate--homocysteine methyltransferase
LRCPRQRERERLCLADYFASVASGKVDVVPLQVVTMGEAASEAIQRLQDAGNYSEAYFVHGLAVEMAEGLADYANRLVRHELGLSGEQGRRYSWGYPAIPDLEDHTKVFQLLPASTSIGVELTDAFQLVPEQSTAAIIVHHPQSSYFAVRDERAAALPS